MTVANLYTIKQLCDYGKRCFLLFEDDYDAKVDSQILMATVLNKPTSYLLTWPGHKLNEQQKAQFKHFVERRRLGEPVAFITGKQEFWSLPFFVAPCTLIPRPDTETLVEQVLANNNHANLSLLDLGTGTGAIALALASEQSNWQIDAVDFNVEAVQLAKTNAQHLALNNVNIYQSDWFSNIGSEKYFDVIVSNPPYIDGNDTHLNDGDLRFEPRSALVASDNGYADIRQIIDKARQYLQGGGQLYLEHGFEQHLVVQELFSDYGYKNIHTYNDFGGNPRITMAIKT